MKLLVAVDQNWAIGHEGQMLFDLPGDLTFFRETTWNHVLVLGQKTLNAFPNGNPLPNRIHIVLSRTPKPNENHLQYVTFDKLSEVIKPYIRQGKEIFVVGGGEIYNLLLPYVAQAIVTHIEAIAPKADTYFPNLAQIPEWKETSRLAPKKENGIFYWVSLYRNANVKMLP